MASIRRGTVREIYFMKRHFSKRTVRNRSFTGRGKAASKRIDPARFVQKATEVEVEEYEPQHKFSDFDLESSLVRSVEKKGYMHPTAIQDQAIPVALSGKDVIGIADTGSGKTAAFLLPLMDSSIRDKSNRTLIIAPTRELAQQISEEFISFAKGMGIYSTVCVGGVALGPQISSLRRRPNFVIGTPGRLKDLVDRKIIKMQHFNSIVLDEADRMLDMGFIDDIKYLMGLLPKERHTLLFSATIPQEIEKLIHTFLKDPVKVSVKTGETSGNIEQDVIKVKGMHQKMEKLCELLEDRDEYSKVLIFGQTKHGVRKIADQLQQKGFKVESIHGDKSQNLRKRALQQFSNNRIQALIATDVAARGLDIADVTHVINFDAPDTYDNYVHRIGRTGRAKSKGKALTFVD